MVQPRFRLAGDHLVVALDAVHAEWGTELLERCDVLAHLGDLAVCDVSSDDDEVRMLGVDQVDDAPGGAVPARARHGGR